MTLPYFTESKEVLNHIFKAAPIPFLGQKRNFIPSFINVLNEFFHKTKLEQEQVIILDIFGGSGLLSHNVKYHFRDCEVVWNDFDNYQERLDNIETTNILLKELDSEILYKYKADEKISEQDSFKLKEILKNHYEKYKFLDYITISPKVLFSGTYLHSLDDFLKQKSFYKQAGKKNHNAQGYLKNILRESLDFRKLIEKYKQIAKNNNKTLLLVADPPYLNTNLDGYSKNYFTILDFIDLVLELKNEYFIMFCSEKSLMFEFMLKIYDLIDFKRANLSKIARANCISKIKADEYLLYDFCTKNI